GHRIAAVAQFDAHVVVRPFYDAVAGGHQGALDMGRIPSAADQSFGRVHRVLGVRDGLTFGDVSDQTFTGLGDGNDAGRGFVPTAIGDHRRSVALEDGHTGVSCPQIDTNNALHTAFLAASANRKLTYNSPRLIRLSQVFAVSSSGASLTARSASMTALFSIFAA